MRFVLFLILIASFAAADPAYAGFDASFCAKLWGKFTARLGGKKYTSGLAQELGENPQIFLWKKMAADPAAAARLEQEISETFQHGAIVSKKAFTQEGQKNQTAYVKFANGLQGVMKWGDHSRAGKEVAAYLVDRALGLNLVPLTLRRVMEDGSVVSVQLRVMGAKFGGNKIPSEMRILDLLLYNKDRHYENWLVAQGRPIAIDHDNNTFFAQLLDVGQVLHPKEIYGDILKSNPELLKKIESISPEQWRELLSPHITKEELNSFIDRRSRLLQSGHELGVL